MIVKLESGSTVRLIGDPHLGRSFETGVPLDRRGEREARQLQKFKDQLNEPGFNYIVVVGDLFDHPYVSFGVVLDAYKALANAAAAHPKTRYVVMAGNHDMPRNIEAVGAFSALEAMCHLRADNLSVISKPAQIGEVACFPWVWQTPAREQKILSPVAHEKVGIVVGHWDLMIYGENTDHLAPTRLLKDTYGEVPLWGGHYHIPGEYEVDGITVNCTGSMEPYSHGEDPNGDIYVTLTPAQLEATDPSDLRDKCVRVLLRDGEEMPTGVDCLALTPKRVSGDLDDLVIASGGEFSWADILNKKLQDLPAHVQAFIKERLHNVG